MTGLAYEYLLAHLLRYPRVHRLFMKWYRRWHKWLHPSVTAFWVVDYPERLVEITQATWSKRLGRPISKDEALQIIRSFRNLFSLMKEVRANGK